MPETAAVVVVVKSSVLKFLLGPDNNCIKSHRMEIHKTKRKGIKPCSQTTDPARLRSQDCSFIDVFSD